MATRVVVMLAVFVGACGDDGHGGGDGGPGGTARLKQRLDVSSTIGFAITDVQAASARSLALPADEDCMPSTLYAVQEDGSMVVTTVRESIDTETDAGICTTNQQREQAKAVWSTAKYAVIEYQPPLAIGPEQSGSAEQCRFVVMRKSDGALYCHDNDDAGGMVAEIEGPNDKLYYGSRGVLARLDMSVDPPTATVIDDNAQTGDFFDRFDVDAMDNALAAGSFGVRVFKANGGLQNVSAMQEQCQWIDPDGSFYVMTEHLQTMDLPQRVIVQKLEGATYTPRQVGLIVAGGGNSPPCTVALAAGTQSLAWRQSPPELYELASADGGGLCWRAGENPNGACDSDDDCAGTCGPSAACGSGNCCSGGGHPNRPCTQPSDCASVCVTAGEAHPVSGISTVRSAMGRDGKVFVQGTDAAGNGAVIQVTVPGFAQTTLLAPGEYTLTAISLSSDGEMTFAGLRNSDGAFVLGNCSSAGCSVLNATAPAVTALQRIN